MCRGGEDLPIHVKAAVLDLINGDFVTWNRYVDGGVKILTFSGIMLLAYEEYYAGDAETEKGCQACEESPEDFGY